MRSTLNLQTVYQSLMSDIAAGKLIVIDAGTGSELQRRGVPMRPAAWCALGTETHPQILCELHQDYIKAGARVITANTFASTREILETDGIGKKFASLNQRSVEIACEARARQNANDTVAVAGSITHIIPAGNSRLPQPSDACRYQDNCSEMVALHKAAGADFIIAEMVGDPVYTPCIIRAAHANNMPIWTGLSSMSESPQQPMACASPSMPLTEALPPIVEAGSEVMGIMHTSASSTAAAIDVLKMHWRGPLMAYPDSVTPRRKGQTDMNLSDVINVAELVEYCRQWQQQGVQILGGCCGLSVSHIQALSNSMNRF